MAQISDQTKHVHGGGGDVYRGNMQLFLRQTIIRGKPKVIEMETSFFLLFNSFKRFLVT